MNGALAAVALGALLASLVPVPVQANVIYILAPTAVTPGEPSSVPSAGTREIGFDLELTDAASADGNFALSGPYNNPLSRILPRYDGDVREFVRFGVSTEAYAATPTQRAGSLDISLSFSASGDVTTGRIVTQGLTTALDLIITDNVVSGFVSGLPSGTGDAFCGALPDTRGCFISGFLIHAGVSTPDPASVPEAGPVGVPEPGSLALLGVGGLGLAATCCRRRRDTEA